MPAAFARAVPAWDSLPGPALQLVGGFVIDTETSEVIEVVRVVSGTGDSGVVAAKSPVP